jgi:hypothetical protein
MHAVEIPKRAMDRITRVLSLRMVHLLLEEQASLQGILWKPGAAMSMTVVGSGSGSEA